MKADLSDFGGGEEPHRWAPKARAAADVDLGFLVVLVEPSDVSVLEAHQQRKGPDLAAMRMPSEVQVNAVPSEPGNL